ncbi:uncharacterized protein A4U43_C03F31050 [Asparagus officinalis]|uniref:Uncharacterized protein n=1 Tax=Asparagus officinalis TaxID=4686 RepID=A0A5P1FGZ8_ASPOF|nr:uncharacterized protein A4U43_C03F31050 [Asparagus officinalis]
MGGPSVRRSESTCRGKEPIKEEMTPPAGLEYPFLHNVTEIREEEWDEVVPHRDIEGRPSICSKIYGWMEQVRTEYLKLLGEVASLRADRGVNSERATETPALSASEVDGLRRELEESKRKVKRLDEALQKRDHTLA